MTTYLTARSQIVTPLFLLTDVVCIQSYQQGLHWIRFEQQEHYGPLSDSDVIDTLLNFAHANLFDGQHDSTLTQRLCSYFGMLHGAVLSDQGTIQRGVTALVQLHMEDCLRGYTAGREFFFLDAERDEERLLTVQIVAQRLKELFSEYCDASDSERLLQFCIGDLLGQLSGCLFPWTSTEHQAWEAESIAMLGYVCALPKTCLALSINTPPLKAVS